MEGLCDEAGTGSWEMGAAGGCDGWDVTGWKGKRMAEGEGWVVCARLAGAASSDGRVRSLEWSLGAQREPGWCQARTLNERETSVGL